jgi:UDP-glucuronate 4-epimerase
MSQIYQATMAARRGEAVSFARPCVKNWSYAPDTAADMAALLDAPDWKRRVYNLGAPHAWPLTDWCERLAGRFGDFAYHIGKEGDDESMRIDLWGDRDGSLLSWQAFEADFARPAPHDLDEAFADYLAFLDGPGRSAAA